MFYSSRALSRVFFGGALFAAAMASHALTYPLPDRRDDSLIGEYPHKTTYATARHEDTLLDIAREYDIGHGCGWCHKHI